jgi:hypothetical protein
LLKRWRSTTFVFSLNASSTASVIRTIENKLHACHNPHEPLREDPAYYDKRCLECHSEDKECEKSAVRQELSSRRQELHVVSHAKVRYRAHFKFTDHYIRIVRRVRSIHQINAMKVLC